jgi:hypothetical protein
MNLEADYGLKLNDDVEIRIYDSTADVGIGYDSPLKICVCAFPDTECI